MFKNKSNGMFRTNEKSKFTAVYAHNGELDTLSEEVKILQIAKLSDDYIIVEYLETE